MFNKDAFNALWKLQKEAGLNLSFPRKVIMASAVSSAGGTIHEPIVAVSASVVYEAHNGDIIYLYGQYDNTGYGTAAAQLYNKPPTISQLNKVNSNLFKGAWQKDNLQDTLPNDSFRDCLTDELKCAGRLFAGLFCLNVGTARITPDKAPNYSINYSVIK